MIHRRRPIFPSPVTLLHHPLVFQPCQIGRDDATAAKVTSSLQRTHTPTSASNSLILAGPTERQILTLTHLEIEGGQHE